MSQTDIDEQNARANAHLNDQVETLTEGTPGAGDYFLFADDENGVQKVAAEDVGTGGGGGGSTAPTEITWADLDAALNDTGLTPGGRYLITDFQTVHTIPETADVNTATAEPLIVTAVDAYTLDPVAVSTLYPGDIIYYSAANTPSKMPGCEKGYIYRRIDPVKAIDAPFDWRNVKFRRYLTAAPAYSSGTTYGAGDTVVYNDTLYTALKAGVVGQNPEGGSGNNWVQLDFYNGEYIGISPDFWTLLNSFSGGLKMIIPTDPADYQDHLLTEDNTCTFITVEKPAESGDLLVVNSFIRSGSSQVRLGSTAARVLIGSESLMIDVNGADAVIFGQSVTVGTGAGHLYIGPCNLTTVGPLCDNCIVGGGSNGIVFEGQNVDCAVNRGCFGITFGFNSNLTQFRNNASNISVGPNVYGLIINSTSSAGPLNVTVDNGVQSDGVPVAVGPTLLDGTLSLRISKVAGQANPMLVSIDGTTPAAPILVLTALDA